MIDSEKTWAIFWFAVILTICILIGSCTVMSNNEDARKAADMKALIAQGQSPIEARCAVYGPTVDSSVAVCQTAATSAAIIKSIKAGEAK